MELSEKKSIEWSLYALTFCSSRNFLFVFNLSIYAFFFSKENPLFIWHLRIGRNWEKMWFLLTLFFKFLNQLSGIKSLSNGSTSPCPVARTSFVKGFNKNFILFCGDISYNLKFFMVKICAQICLTCQRMAPFAASIINDKLFVVCL